MKNRDKDGIKNLNCCSNYEKYFSTKFQSVA